MTTRKPTPRFSASLGLCALGLGFVLAFAAGCRVSGEAVEPGESLAADRNLLNNANESGDGSSSSDSATVASSSSAQDGGSSSSASTGSTSSASAGSSSSASGDTSGGASSSSAAASVVSITSVSPAKGSTAGGTSVTIGGSGFRAGSGFTITFGGYACANPMVNDSTTIVCTTAAASVSGYSDVVVTNGGTGAGSATLTSGFRYLIIPTVSTVSPTTGVQAGSYQLAITGSSFVNGATVSIGGVSCPATYLSSTSMTCTVPAGTTTTPMDVVVTNPDTGAGTMASAFAYRALPTIASVDPNHGLHLGGNTVTLTGTGFRSSPSVTIGTSSCGSVNLTGSTQITCSVPAGTEGAKAVIVTNDDAQSVTLTGGYTYIPSPTLSSVSPTSGALAGGATLTLTGLNFQTGATLYVGATQCGSASYVSATEYRCVLPSKAAGTYDVRIVNPDAGENTLANAFNYNSLPTLTSVSPTFGTTAGGSTLTLVGSGYLTGASAKVGGVNCGTTSIISATAATCTTPAASAGTVAVSLANLDGQGVNLATAFRYFNPATSIALANSTTNTTLSVCSTAFTASLLDQSQNQTIALGQTVVSLAGAGAGGGFYTDSGCSNATSTVTIANGSFTVPLYYRNSGSTPLNVTLSASSGSLTLATFNYAAWSATPYLVFDKVNQTFPVAYLDQYPTMALTLNVDNYQTASNSDAGMTYSCLFDQVVDGSVAGGTSCASLPGTMSFSTSTGVLTWSPNMLAWGPYELKFTGTNASGSGSKILVVDVREQYDRTGLLADYQAQFGTRSGQVTGGTQTTWSDLTNSGFNITLAGADSQTWSGDGTVGTNPYSVSLGSGAKLPIGATNTSMTQVAFAAWVKPSSVGTADAIVLGNGGGAANGFVLKQGSGGTGNVEFRVGDGAGTAGGYDRLVKLMGPTLYYRFNEPSGATGVTDSISSVSATVVGTLAFQQTGLLTNDPDKSITFSGSGTYVKVPNDASILPSGNGGRTVCAWAKPSSIAGWRVIYDQGTFADEQRMGLFQFNGTMYWSGWNRDVSVASYWSAGENRFVCGTYDGTSATLYRDGTSVTTAVLAWNTVTYNARIGAAVDNNSLFAGTIDEVMVFGKALTANQIKLLYLMSSQKYCSSSTAMANNTWYHLGGSYDGSILQLFVNGKTECAMSYNGSTLGGSTDLYAGSNSVGGNAWAGRVADLLVYDQAGDGSKPGLHHNATVSRFIGQSGTPARDPMLSTVVANNAKVPHDGSAKAVLIAIPRTPWNDLAGAGKTVEIYVKTGAASMSGAGTCQAPSSTCAKAWDVGGGHYVAYGVSSTQNSVDFAARVVGDATQGIDFRQPQSVSFDSNQFTGANGATLSANGTVDSTYAGKNLYITGGTITFAASSDGIGLGDVIMTGGTLTHSTTSGVTLSRINLSGAGLSFQGGLVDLNGKGYTAAKSAGPGGSASATIASVGNTAASHGGVGGGCPAANGCGAQGATYDDYRDPKLPGGGGQDNGGGVFRFVGTNPCFLTSSVTIRADGNMSGAGGTVNLRCPYLTTGPSWTGVVSANGGGGWSGWGQTDAGGGRVALVSSNAGFGMGGAFAAPTTATELSSFKSKVMARGADATANTQYGHGGAGTVFHKTSAQTYGDLYIANSTSQVQTRYNFGKTKLLSFAGTVNGTPSGSALPVAVATPTGFHAGYTDVYAGVMLRPDVTYNAGTGADPTDDNILTISGNGTTSFTMTGAISGVSNGAVFRSIDILDHLHIGSGVYLYSDGDIYAKNGDPVAGTPTSITLTGKWNLPNGSFSYPGFGNSTAFSITNAQFRTDDGLQSSGATLTSISIGTSGTVEAFGTTSATSLSLTGTGYGGFETLSLTGNLSMDGNQNPAMNLGILNAANYIQSNGYVGSYASSNTAVTQMTFNLTGSLTMNGGYLHAEGTGYPDGYSYAPSGTSVSLASVQTSGASHGGLGGYRQSRTAADVGPTYDDYRDPKLPGAGAIGQAGGGVVQINATGNCTLNNGSVIEADAWNARGAAGGSVNMKCGGFGGTSWSGRISANGGTAYCCNTSGGGGGRVALISSGNAGSFTGSLPFPSNSSSLTSVTARVQAHGGYGMVLGGYGGEATGGGGAGTVFMKHSALTNGVLIVNNDGGGGNLQAGNTKLVSLAGTVNGAPGTSTLPISVTMGGALNSNHDNLFKGMRLRPNTGFNNGTANDWSDDNLLTVSGNTSTVLTVTNNISGVNNGDPYRTIDVLDYISILGGAVLESNGDVYSLHGSIEAPDTGTYLIGGKYVMNGGAQFFYPGYTNNLAIAHSGGWWTFTDYNSTGATVNGFTVNSGSLSVTGNFAVPSNFNLAGGTMTVDQWVTGTDFKVSGTGALTTTGISLTGNLNMSSTAATGITAQTIIAASYNQTAGTVTHPVSTSSKTNRLEVTLSNSFTLTGGAIDVDKKGWPVGGGFGSVTYSTANASVTYAGGSHAGTGARRIDYLTSAVGPTYDDYQNPYYPGGAATGGCDPGGGVVRVIATNACVLGGTANIYARSGCAGAGGSIYMKCSGYTTTGWTGKISAEGGTSAWGWASGGGGMVALHSTGDNTAWSGNMPFPNSTSSMTTFAARVSAAGGASWAPTYGGGGPGTIYVKHSGLTYGDLILYGNQSTTTAGDGAAVLRASTAGSNTLHLDSDNNTVQVTNGGTPFASLVNLFKNQVVHIWPTAGGSNDPASGTRTSITLSGGNTSNDFVDTNGPFSAININDDYSYRMTEHLDHLEIGKSAIVDFSATDLWVAGCDIHSAASTTFDVPSGSKLTAHALSAASCTTKTTTSGGSQTIFSSYVY